MKGIMKKIISVVLAAAMIISGISYVPGPRTVEAAGTVTTDTYTAEITDGQTTFGDSETEGAVTYHNYVRYAASIAGKSAEDSGDGCLADYAIDNNSGTRWAAKTSGDSGWITVDLGAAYSINKVYVNWEVANAKTYKIQYSHNNTDFTDAVTVGSSSGGTETAYEGNRIDKVTLKNEIKARYIRIQVVERCTISASDTSKHGGVSIYEIGIYGISAKAVGVNADKSGYYTDDASTTGWKTVFGPTDEDDTTLKNYLSYTKYRQITASADAYSGKMEPSRIMDGNVEKYDDDSDARWAAESQVDGHYITINLGTEYNISKVCISWEVAQSAIYNIETSNDGVNFDTAATVTPTCWNKHKVDKVTFNSTVKAQYVRIYTIKRANGYGMSIWEMGIYGTDEEIAQAYSTNAFDGYTGTSGNLLEAENFSTDISTGISSMDKSGLSNNKYLGGSIAGSVAGYKVYFDRNTSKVKFKYSAKSSNAAGKIKMYVDQMSGTPAATITTSATGGDDWETYKEVTVDDVNIPYGDHKIYLVMEPDSGMKYVANIDYFQFEYAPEKLTDKHEAENAHAFTIGSMNGQHNVQQSAGKFSNNQAVGNMNTLASANDPAYLTTYVNVTQAGIYNLNINYATQTDTKLAYRMDDGDWTNVDIAATSTADTAWDTVGTVTAAVPIEFSEGIHKIDITGALQDDGTNQWANLDCFTFTRATYAKTAFEYRNTNLTGNKIEGEDFDSSYGTVKKDTGTGYGQSGTGNLGGSESGSWAEYNVFFDRKTSKVKFRYSANSEAEGNIEIYVDEITDTPVATIHTTARTGWGDYTDLTGNAVIPSGNHKIYLKFVPDSGKKYVANIDYFTFEYAPEDVEINNEAENAHAYTQGSAETPYTLENNDSFSNKYAVGGMNTWPADGRSYLTTYVNAEHKGDYKLTIAYAANNSKNTNIDYRINGTDDNSWVSLDAASTGGWETVKTLTTTVTLNKGINIIDITGASNVYYADNSDWQQANIDYFRLDRIVDETNLAYGKPVTAGGSESKNPSENAVDADPDTRWASGGSDNNWMTIDLEGMYEIEEVRLLFERAYANDFEIQLSRDGETWVTARTVTNFNNDADIGEGGKIEWVSPNEGEEGHVCLGKAAYVKLKVSDVAQNYGGVSIYEFEVRGKKIPAGISDVVLNRSADSNSSEDTRPASDAVDGKDSTRWASNKDEANPYVTVDLGRQCQLQSVDLKFERAYAKSFRIQVSDDGQTWTDAATVNNWTEHGDETVVNTDEFKNKILGCSLHLDNVTASYVRFYTDERIKDGWGVSLHEFEVWGKDLSKTDYWQAQAGKQYGIYPVSKLQKSEMDGTSLIDSSLVQGDVLATDDTYEVIYEPGKEVFFYVNPYGYEIDYNNDQVCWSSQESGSGLWGASEHSESIAKYATQTEATVKYILPAGLDFGSADYVITEIGCQVWKKENLSNNEPIAGKSPQFNSRFKIKVLKSHDIFIEDSIRENGCLGVRDPESGASYEWQRSSDGSTDWQTVAEKRYDLTIVNNNGQTVNVAMDLGGGQYYRVRKVGSEKWSQPYRIPFYNNVQNGGFENPAMFAPGEDGAEFPFNANGDEQQYPNGYPGMVWKTTGPGWSNGVNSVRVGHDIEIVNGRNLRVNQSGQENQFSVTLEEMYKDNSHGDQFAELNCENVGALYQDILTTPGSECYWDLDHAGRWNQNTMYVVAMSSQDAQAYTTKEQIATIVEAAKEKNLSDTGAADYSAQTEITLDDGSKAYVWKVMSPETKGVWAHHSGKYNVPEGETNYLTRFFFVSEGGAKRNETDTPNETVGNLLDNVSFAMKQSYTIEYYVNGEKQETATVSGLVDPYSRVGIPSSITGVDLSKYTLTESTIGGTDASTTVPYYLDTDRKMTVAYNHNNLKLYYESGTIAITKIVEGLPELPNDYRITLKLQSEDGATTYKTEELTKDSFTKIDKAADSDPDRYFVTINIKTSDVGLTTKTNYIISEVVANPSIEISGSYRGYLSQVTTAEGTVDVPLSDLNKTDLTYATTFYYDVDTENATTITNAYKLSHQLTISKKVTGNMSDTNKSFHFTLGLKLNDTAVDAVTAGNGASATGTGAYEFNLKDSESITFEVYDGCVALISEDDYSSDYYTASWSASGTDITRADNGLSVTTAGISAESEIVCTNDNNDIGDVEVQGFQMNTNSAEGGVSEFNPSFRVVCRVSKNTIKRKDVKRFGVIYGRSSELDVDDKSKLAEEMVLEPADAYKDYVYIHNSTDAGVYKNWTTKDDDEHPAEYWDYYALTFVGKNYVYEALEEKLTFRAFAILDDGNGGEIVEYGNNIFTVNMYEIADNLYQNQKISTKEGHEFLYDNILNVVTIKNNRLGICQSMLKALNVTSASDENYALANGTYKDMLNYVYCQKGYTYHSESGSSGHGAFEPINIDASKLLTNLNAASGTAYSTVFDWIYSETGKYGYNGFYKKVPYAWDNGIYKDYIKK